MQGRTFLNDGIYAATETPFANRRSRCKEIAENKAEAYRVYVEHLFSTYDAADVRIFAKDAKKIMLNANAFKEADNGELQGFLQYVKTGKVTTEYTGRIEQMIQTVKQNELARKEYHILPVALMDAFDEGSRQKALETAKTMLTMGYPLADICKISGLSPNEVQSIGNL